MIYTVRSGETLSDVILNSTGSILNWEDILNANGFTDWSPELYVGQQIIIPDDIVGQSNVKNVLDTYPANNNYAAADFMIQVLALINKSNPVTDQLQDLDGNIYTTIDIGTLRIIVQNFKCTKYADGSDIPNITDNSAWAADSLGAQCSYNNDSGNKDIYGLLYNWFSINNVKGLAYLEKNGIQDLDWRVWSDDDINYLVTLLGGSSLAGGKLKEVGLVHWLAPNLGATDDYGFKGLPAGCRQGDYGDFEQLDGSAYFKSGSATGKALSLCNGNIEALLLFYENYQHFGFSIRLVKDIIIDDDMKYEQVINLNAADDTIITTLLATAQIPFTYLIEDSSGNPIGGEDMIRSRTLIVGFWVLDIYSAVGYTGAVLKIVY